MISKTTNRFRDALAKLPKDIQRQAQASYKLFSDDPNHPSLRFKKVHTTEPIYSARINIDYRALGIVDGEEIIWFWIGSHAEYDKLLDQL
jgi:mRNA-degrading endonuclease RelE of RelBE toxin-antitoxin system